jgi:hypothetical protein
MEAEYGIREVLLKSQTPAMLQKGNRRSDQFLTIDPNGDVPTEGAYPVIYRSTEPPECGVLVHGGCRACCSTPCTRRARA